MTPMLKAAAALSALVLLSGCETINETLEKAPFRGDKTKAPVTETQEAAKVPATPETRAPASAPAVRTPAAAYIVPMGGPNTFSLSVSSCLSGCDIVNVMIDPDNYWQRTAPEGTVKGQGRNRMYDDVANVFQAQGFYAFQGQLDILPGNQQTCSEYEPGGQVFFISMSRNSGQRVVNYDTGCAGSASADAAADSINALVGIGDYMDVVSGNAPAAP